MKKLYIAMAIAGMVGLTASNAAVITSFGDLGTATGSITAGSTGGSPPSGASDTSDFTFDFTMTTPASLTKSAVVLEFGGGFSGTSLKLENDRLVFRSGGTAAGTMLYVTSTELSASTSYRVTGSLFMNPVAGDDEMRLYLNEADAVDSAFANHTPSVDMGGDWTGGNDYGYGLVGGGDYLTGTPTSPDGTGLSASFDGTLTSDLDYYTDTYLAVPEPATLSMVASAGLLLMMFRRREGR